MSEDASIYIDRAGGTSQRCGNPPAFVYSIDESYKPLISKLKHRGFVDAETAESAYMLKLVSYSHMMPYLSASMHRPIGVKPTVKEAHDLLILDRRLQSIIFQYIGVFETQMRAQYSHWMETFHGAFPHYEKDLFLRPHNYESAMKHYETEARRKLRKGNKRLVDAASKYDGRLPIWDAVECMTLGTLSMFFSNTKDLEVTKRVSESFSVTKSELSSWLKTIASVRNICAHFDPYIVRKEIPSTPLRIDGVECSNRDPFYIVLILLHLLSCDVLFSDFNLMYTYAMREEICNAVESFTHTFECSVTALGIPEDWKQLMDRTVGVRR